MTRTCSFATTRLSVDEWHDAGARTGDDLVETLTGLLTPATTHFLPPEWQGAFDPERATVWIAERDEESATLLVVDRESGDAVGLMILAEFPAAASPDLVDVRLGYLLAEHAWGRGLASELIEGFLEWCRSEPAVRSVTGGVDADNPASARVLTKNGFRRSGTSPGDEQIYELTLT